MSKSTKTIFLVIAIMCIMIVLLHMHTKEGEKVLIRLDEKMLSDITYNYLGLELPCESITATVTGDGSVCLRAVTSPHSLLEVLDKNGIELSTGIALMVKLLPERAVALCELSVSLKNDELILTPTRFEINDIDISPQLLPPLFKDGISRAVNDYLKKAGITPKGFEVRTGSICIEV